MVSNETLAERIRQRRVRRKDGEEKKLFGGIGFLLNANMPVSRWNESGIIWPVRHFSR